MSEYTGDYFLDPSITIKQEPIPENSLNISASVPIPVVRRDVNDYRDLGLYFESSQSPSYQEQLGLISQVSLNSGLIENTAMWGTKIDMDVIKTDTLMRMDEDDIFQVDKADLIQGPTLAELNANDETLLGNLNFDDLLLPEEGTYNYSTLTQNSNVAQKFLTSVVSQNNINNNSNRLPTYTQPNANFYRENTNLMANTLYDFNSKNSPDLFPTNENSFISSTSAPSAPPLTAFQQKHSTLHELLMKRDTGGESPDRTVLGKSVPGPSSPVVTPSTKQTRSHISRLSSSAPTHLGLEQIWQRREPRQHLLSTGSLAEAGSTSSLSTGGVLSPEAPDFSHDEFESDEDSEHYEDFSSDNGDSDYDENDPTSKSTGASKKERFFWQYNVQAKGPKGQRLVMKCKMEDPHVLHEVTDPVFSPDCSVRGIKHSGKARKGDGNDLTPNARKLFNIGKELDKLGRIINDMTPVSELPFNVRPKTRKEKNKLASRACRLKKKAQHEANKIKLHGLESEHKKIINGLSQVKQIFVMKMGEPVPDNQELIMNHVDKIVKSATRIKIAGQSTEYVNRVLEKVKSGSNSAVLEEL